MPQNYNGYVYCLNNPLVYTDPSGELFWILPNIGWSNQGGLSIGITFVVGIPGGASAQVGVGYNFKSNDVYGYAGATLAMNTVYASVSSQSGWSAGYMAGASIYSGLPISTNFLTVGANYNISHDSWSGNLSAWSVAQNGWAFNPSVSAMVLPEHTSNFVRGQGFRNNDAVLNRFVETSNHKGALDYFGFEGEFDSERTNPGATDKDGSIFYNETAFSKGYHYLYSIAMEEKFHQLDILKGNYEGVKWNDELENVINHGIGEHKAKMYIYKRQGLFYKYKYENLISDINKYGRDAGYYYEGNASALYFTSRYWHIIYRIPRLW
jgi:hypothetical protein